jgi:hypothetical protein
MSSCPTYQVTESTFFAIFHVPGESTCHYAPHTGDWVYICRDVPRTRWVHVTMSHVPGEWESTLVAISHVPGESTCHHIPCIRWMRVYIWGDVPYITWHSPHSWCPMYSVTDPNLVRCPSERREANSPASGQLNCSHRSKSHINNAVGVYRKSTRCPLQGTVVCMLRKRMLATSNSPTSIIRMTVILTKYATSGKYWIHTGGSLSKIKPFLYKY